MKLKFEIKETLLQLAQSIQELSKDEYTEKIPLLSQASIGEHTRHIIELFVQLLQGYEAGEVNYDDRKRDLRLQNEIDFAVESIATIISRIQAPNKQLRIVSLMDNDHDQITSSYDRELLYNLEHCIHHQAIIKIGLLCLDKSVVDENYGVAKSTLVYREQCAQ